MKSATEATLNSTRTGFFKNVNSWTSTKAPTTQLSVCTCTGVAESTLESVHLLLSRKGFKLVHRLSSSEVVVALWHGFHIVCCQSIKSILRSRHTLRTCQVSKTSWIAYNAVNVLTIKRKEVSNRRDLLFNPQCI